jgi:hypothetical protein
MARWPTSLAFQAIGQRLADELGARARVVRFEGPVDEALRREEARLSGGQAAIVYGFDSREPTLFSGSRVSLHEVMPVEFAVIVKAAAQSSSDRAMETLDGLMDDVADTVITGDSSLWNIWTAGFQAVGDGALRRLDISPDAYARAVRKEFVRRTDYSE